MASATRTFEALLHNTASATVLEGGEKINVIPAEVVVEIDCRLLPGFGPQDIDRRAERPRGRGDGLRVDSPRPRQRRARHGDVRHARRCARAELDPTLAPYRCCSQGVTDGRFFSRSGIQTYGFLPMQLPEEMGFMELIHAEDERLPAPSLEFGTQAISRVLERFV